MIDLSLAGTVLSWLLLLLGIQVSLYPWIRRILPGVAVPVSWTSGVFICTLTSWYAVSLGLPMETGTLPALVLFTAALLRYGKTGYLGISSEWQYYLLFCTVFAAMLAVRMGNPDINGAEKFMDHGFLASIIRTPQVPPLDPWFAGGYLNVYYYLGHWMLAFLGTVARIPSNILFNLALPTIAGLAAVNLYGVGRLVLSCTRMLPVLALFIVNPFFICLVLSGTDSFSLLWNSSRVIQNTINEYPLFSFLFGDVHAHVLDVLPQTFLVLMITAAFLRWRLLAGPGRIFLILLTGLGLSLIPAVNSWDILIWAPMVIASGVCLVVSCYPGVPVPRLPGSVLQDIRICIRNRDPAWVCSPAGSAILYLFAVPATGLALISPLLLGMQTQGIEGIGFVHTPSQITEFLMVHGWFLLGILISLRQEIRRRPWILVLLLPFFLTGYLSAGVAAVFLLWILARRRGIPDLLAAGGLSILLFCEILYLMDNMGDTWYRMNTVFKLYIGAWLLCGTGSALMIGSDIDLLFSGSPVVKKRIPGIVITLLLLVCLVVPSLAVFSSNGKEPTLDGLSWLAGSHHGDAEAVAFLRSLTGDHVLVEAVGDEYQYTGRISAYTGIPAVLGWQFHEYMWRGDNPAGWFRERARDVRSIYEDPRETIPLMEKYQADLLYVGPEERSKYKVHIPEKDLQVLYKNRDVTLYRHEAR